MQKRKKSFMVLSIILILLLSVYFGLQFWNKNQDKKEKAREEAKTAYVTDLDSISGIKYDVGQGELSFVKENEKWYDAKDKDFPLAQSYLQKMETNFVKLKANRELKNGDSMQDYGLKEPAYTIVLTDSDGKETSLYYGNTTGDDYYVTVNDTEKVYTVSSTTISDLQYSLEDMAQLDTYPAIGSGNLKKVEITEKDRNDTYDSEKEEDSKNIAAVAGGLGAVQLEKAADYSVEEEALAGYGLDKETRITVKADFTVDKEEESLTLYIGNTDGNGNRYIMMDDSRIVYLISDEVCSNILNKNSE